MKSVKSQINDILVEAGCLDERKLTCGGKQKGKSGIDNAVVSGGMLDNYRHVTIKGNVLYISQIRNRAYTLLAELPFADITKIEIKNKLFSKRLNIYAHSGFFDMEIIHNAVYGKAYTDYGCAKEIIKEIERFKK